jgi:phosphatidylinositol glycan class O
LGTKHDVRFIPIPIPIQKPPTTTMQRIKALMSGTLPTFIDASSNFNSYVIEDDNLIQQLANNNKSVVFTGDDTWISLFPLEHFKETHAYPSFNVKDIDTVDRSVNKILMTILNTKSTQWDLIIAHYLVSSGLNQSKK